jgi:hypothetical protein
MNLVTGLWGMNVHVPGQDVPGVSGLPCHRRLIADLFNAVRVVWRHLGMFDGICTFRCLDHGERHVLRS